MALGIILVGAAILAVFPVKDKNSMFGMIVIRSRWIVGILLAIISLILLVVFSGVTNS